MKEEVAFELGSFYANAGILGLVRMLECDYKKVKENIGLMVLYCT